MTAGCTGDSDIVIWYAEHHCHGDLLVARRIVARWTAPEAHYWLRVAFGAEAKDCGHNEAARRSHAGGNVGAAGSSS